METASDSTPVLAVRNLSKRFGGVQALDSVDFTVAPGEVHGLLGQNGSGKSTLIKTLAGFHEPDAGGLEIDGEQVRLPLRPGQFRELGLSFVHQDLGLVPDLSVVENLRASDLAVRNRWRISWRAERRMARAVFGRYGVDLDPGARVSRLSQTDQARLAIVRAVEDMRTARGSGDTPGVLLLDEPTAFLPREGTEQLFGLVRTIVASGSSVVFVSHDLDEVREITDRITVLRDGRVVGTVVTADVTGHDLVGLIIGRQLEALGARAPHAHREVGASVEHASGGLVRDVSLKLRPGEIVGLTGLLGAGFEDLPYVLFGAIPATSGRLLLDGRAHQLTRMTPRRAMRAGIALLPADRQTSGAFPTLPVVDNVSMLLLGDYTRRRPLQRGRMRRDSRAALDQFDVRPPDPGLTFQSLSGGNQQKAMLAKWFQTSPRLLLLHEPTQGVDVGARQQILSIIDEAAERGTVIVCASADYEQLEAICDRVLVFSRGTVVQQLAGDEVTKDRIAEQCLMSATVAPS